MSVTEQQHSHGQLWKVLMLMQTERLRMCMEEHLADVKVGFLDFEETKVQCNRFWHYD